MPYSAHIDRHGMCPRTSLFSYRATSGLFGGCLISEAQFHKGDALLFGSESRGLSAEVLSFVPRENQLTIPMRAGNRSLNLSNAVALTLYEAWRQNQFA